MPNKNSNYLSNNNGLEHISKILFIITLLYLIIFPLIAIISNRFTFENELLIVIAFIVILILLLFYRISLSKLEKTSPDTNYRMIKKIVTEDMNEINHTLKTLQEDYFEREVKSNAAKEINSKLNEDFVKQYQSQESNFQRLQFAIRNLERKLTENFSDNNYQSGIQTIYLDYKYLKVSDLAELLTSYNNLYKLFYQIAISDNSENINNSLKNHPNDMLEIFSANTGNSIRIKIKTGWLPSLGVNDGDFEVAIPKGFVTFIFFGIILEKVIGGGLTNYQKILEIENTKLEHTKLELEIQELKAKSKNQEQETNAEIQKEILNIYSITSKNEAIRHAEIKQNINITNSQRIIGKH